MAPYEILNWVVLQLDVSISILWSSSRETCCANLKAILCEAGSQCSSFKIGVIWHDFLDKVTTRAAVFCTVHVCAEDEIFDSAGDCKEEHSRYRAVMWQTHNLFSSTFIQVHVALSNGGTISCTPLILEPPTTLSIYVATGWSITCTLHLMSTLQ